MAPLTGPRATSEKNRLVFVGMLAYWPNEDAVLYFYREILPLIMRELPDVTLWIVGKDPPRSLLNLHDGERVHVVANVPDIAPYVQRSMLSVVPLRVGGGTRLKILESLALGTPVISTTVGAEGLDLEDGKQLLLANTPDVFAAHVVALLRNPERYKLFIEAGEAVVREKYRWADIQRQVAGQITTLAGEFSKCRSVHGDQKQAEQISSLCPLCHMRGWLNKFLRLTKK
jgi:glycosyltransferase involved in cell wall biosynthesis